MRPQHLLIIEDDHNIADLVRRVAVESGFTVYTASNFNEISPLYEEFSPQVIVLDILMPGMDGFEVLDMLHRRDSSARIIILSGRNDYRLMAHRMAEGLALAIVATLAKPFRIAEFRQALEKAMET